MIKPTTGYLLCFTLLLAWSSLFSQNNGQFGRRIPNVTAEFRNENLIIEPDATFFNVLIIRNNDDTRAEVFVSINVPEGWSLMASERSNFIIEPNDSVIFPMRAAPSRMVEGEIGYSVIAAINTRDDETITNAYCFIKIPRNSDLQFRPISRISFFDQQTGESKLQFRLENRGNVSELIYLSFQSTNNIEIPGERDNLFNTDLLVRARSDTTISLPVRMVETRGRPQMNVLYRIDMTGFTEEKSFRTSFWFDVLSNFYRYDIPQGERVLIAEVAAQNLLSDQNTSFSGGFRGNLLLEKDRDFSYSFYRYGAGLSSNFLQYSRISLGYNTPRIRISAGDIGGTGLKYGGGKGARVGVNFTDKLILSGFYSQNMFRPINTFGFELTERYSGINSRSRFSVAENQDLNIRSYIGGTRGFLKLADGHSLMADIGISNTQFRDAGIDQTGYGLALDYGGRFGNTRVRIREQLGSDAYFGHFAGRHNFLTRITTPLSETYELEINANDFSYRPLIETNQGVESNRFLSNSSINPLLRKIFSRELIVFAGPVGERKTTNSFMFYDEVNPFTTHSLKLQTGARINDGRGLIISPTLFLGYTFIQSYSEPDPNLFKRPTSLSRSDNFFNARFSLNVRGPEWGAFANYFYGPFSINQEISKFYFDIFAHSVRIMPYFERYIYRDVIFLSSRLGYMYDFAFKSSRVNLNNQVDIFLPNHYTLTVLNSYSYQLSTDLLSEQNFTYSNNYFELRLTKEFNWNQPRVKYYDVEINIFKDLNGNLRREFNEPGIRDILVSINGIEPAEYEMHDVDYRPAGAIISRKLLTNMEGIVRYENLPRGLYRITLENIGTDQDRFFPDNNEFIINVAGDKTVFVPFLERNKIFGRVILNRSRLSTLGRIEPSNVRITAIDSKGRQTSTLSDSRGNFEMYVPSVDNYVVSINNIFRDHFNLRQNDFRANLNGFKQFEVNFVFDEIRRQIEFTPSPTDIQAEIRRVGRTNLSGIVRDATTLQPIRAQVEVVNNATGTAIQQVFTDRATGRYSTSFATGEDLMIVVSASGYWMHSERLILDQFLTIQDAERDILLETITIGARFQLNNLRFASGGIEIPTEALPELDRLVTQLKRNPNVRIRIEGHSDAIETLNNPNISMQRAETIMRYIVENGFSNIEFTGLRDSRPLAPNDTEDNRRRNRRVEIIVTDR